MSASLVIFMRSNRYVFTNECACNMTRDLAEYTPKLHPHVVNLYQDRIGKTMSDVWLYYRSKASGNGFIHPRTRIHTVRVALEKLDRGHRRYPVRLVSVLFVCLRQKRHLNLSEGQTNQKRN
jgi:hypothetical protein